jgi:hypothetical protein
VAKGDASDLYPEYTVFESRLELSRFRCCLIFFSVSSVCRVGTFKYSTTISQSARTVVTLLYSHVFAFLTSVAVRVFFFWHVTTCNLIDRCWRFGGQSVFILSCFLVTSRADICRKVLSL